MVLEKGRVSDSRKIATIYRAAFPESVQFFFAKKSPLRLLDLLELSFRLVFFWGGQALLVKDQQGAVVAYCLFTSRQKPQNRNYWALLTTGIKLIGKICPFEAIRLAFNKLLVFATTKRDKGPTRELVSSAEILSIAVLPSAQGEGIGTQLLHAVLEQLPNEGIALNVRTKNEAARRLYESAGFQVCGSTRDYLGEWLMLIKPAGG